MYGSDTVLIKKYLSQKGAVMMGHSIQVCAMISDLMLIGASAIAIYLFWNVFPVNVVVAVIIVMCFRAWQVQGGSMAWDPKTIKKVLANVKKMS